VWVWNYGAKTTLEKTMNVFTATHKYVAHARQSNAPLLAELYCHAFFTDSGAATTSGARWISTRTASSLPWAAASVRLRGAG